jgi:hypothetical protein
MTKLKCRGAQGKGIGPILISEWSHQKVMPGEIVDGRDPTYARQLMRAYPDCFEIVEAGEELITEKYLPPSKNKMASNKGNK